MVGASVAWLHGGTDRADDPAACRVPGLPGRVGSGLHEDGFGLGSDHDVDSAEGFAVWVGKRLRLMHAPGEPRPDDKHGSPRWIVEDGRVVAGSCCVTSSMTRLGRSGRGCARRRVGAGWRGGPWARCSGKRETCGGNVCSSPAWPTTCPPRGPSSETAVSWGIRDGTNEPARHYWVETGWHAP